MTTKDTSGPAFPAPEAGMAHFNDPAAYPGMTLRDYFATQADLGDVDQLAPHTGVVLLGRPAPKFELDALGCMQWWAEYRSLLRYIEADAMLKAREA